MQQTEMKRRRVTIEFLPSGGKPTVREIELDPLDKVHYHIHADEQRTPVGIRLGVTRGSGSQETYIIPFNSLLYVKLEV